MKLILLAIFVTIVAAEDHKSECETVHVQDKVYKKDILASGLDRPYQLSSYSHEHDHKIFFSYNVGKNEEDTFEIGYIQKGEEKVNTIKEVVNGFASAVDKENHHVYLGGSDGIYKYDMKKKKDSLKKILSGYNIWFMLFHKNLHFIDFPSQKLYKVNISETEAVPVHQDHITEKIFQYVIDKDGDQFITTESGLYRIAHGSNERHMYSKIKLFRGAALDNKGEAYFCGNHSIYTTNKKTHTLEELLSVRNVFGITFDGDDNIIYSNPKSIFHLLPGGCK